MNFNEYEDPARAQRIWEDYTSSGVHQQKLVRVQEVVDSCRTCGDLDLQLDRILSKGSESLVSFVGRPPREQASIGVVDHRNYQMPYEKAIFLESL